MRALSTSPLCPLLLAWAVLISATTAAQQQQPLTPGVVTIVSGPTGCTGNGWLTGMQ